MLKFWIRRVTVEWVIRVYHVRIGRQGESYLSTKGYTELTCASVDSTTIITVTACTVIGARERTAVGNGVFVNEI